MPGDLGTVNIDVHRFFRVIDARHWNNLSTFFRFREPGKTAEEHYYIYRNGLEEISSNSGVGERLQARASFLLDCLEYDTFVNGFATFVERSESKQTEGSVHGLFLNIAKGAGNKRPRSKDRSPFVDRRIKRKESDSKQEGASVTAGETLYNPERRLQHIVGHPLVQVPIPPNKPSPSDVADTSNVASSPVPIHPKIPSLQRSQSAVSDVTDSPSITSSPIPFPQGRLADSSTENSPILPTTSVSSESISTFDNTAEFFSQSQHLQDVVLETLQKGKVLPAWARDRPTWKFQMRVGGKDYGPDVTSWYNQARTNHSLTHNDVDKIALLSGIAHLYDKHHDLDKRTIAYIRNVCLNSIYSAEDEDMRRARAAYAKWHCWVTALRSLVFDETRLAEKEGRDPKPISTRSLVKEILSSFDHCEEERITPIFFAGLNLFRKFNNWKISRSEMSWTMSVVAPLLEEFMSAQHEIMFTCANSSSSAGNDRRGQENQSHQPSRPDVIGLAAEGKAEVFYGEIKLEKTTTEDQHIDRLRLAIFCKDALDSFERTLEATPPVVSFQVIGKQVVVFFAVKVGNAILHCKLSSFSLPVTLEELDLREDVFFPLFQAQTLIKTTAEMLGRKRPTPIAIQVFPTMASPERIKIMTTSEGKKMPQVSQSKQ
ncbi:hypothetical protein BGZ80_004396 [Entomortierella chlamydospora]|uniref:Uncharacterized protein n=1 Tax=Entomortierella chlamydospora TaxID=101097 RepID=A0A9P6SWD2_9FUNG|nr:hypothetical protein BGZ80_004396 [Entomortierella chlamydospora]